MGVLLTAWAANSLSLVQDVKRMNTIDEAFVYLSKAYDFDFNDETKKQLEIILKSLSDKEPIQFTPKDEPTAEQIKETLIKSFQKMELKDIEVLVDKAVGGLDEKNKKAIGDVKDTIVKEIESKGFQSKDEVTSAIDVALKAAKDEFEKELVEVKKSALEAKSND